MHITTSWNTGSLLHHLLPSLLLGFILSCAKSFQAQAPNLREAVKKLLIWAGPWVLSLQQKRKAGLLGRETAREPPKE